MSIPTATPLPAGEVTLSSDNGNIENINTAGAGSASDAPSRSRRSLDAAPQNTSGISIRQREVEKDYFGYKSKETSFIFKTPGGAQYALSSYADPITVSYSSPDFKIPDRHAGQRLADGSSTPETALSKGKITYQVWGIRVRNGQFVTSSYTPPKSGSYYGTLANTPVLSFITANFNSNTLAGKILGNSDYGPDVDIQNATITGPTFSGDATSGGKSGKLEGKFFGKFASTRSSEVSIGGKITFDGDRSLDTVFGGVSYEKKLDDTSQDTNHLTKQ